MRDRQNPAKKDEQGEGGRRDARRGDWTRDGSRGEGEEEEGSEIWG